MIGNVSITSNVLEPIHIDCQSVNHDDSGINQYFNAKITSSGLTKEYDLIELDFNVGKVHCYLSRNDSEPYESFQLFTVYDHSQDY